MRSVTEPDTCVYNITLESPLFCHEVFSDVYNALPDTELENYSRVTAEFKHNLVTEEGLRVERRSILERVGCLGVRKEFKDVGECGEEFHALSEKYEKLEEKCSEADSVQKYQELLSKYNEMYGMLEENGLLMPET